MNLGPNQQKWISALRSGDYAQDTQFLQTEQGFCCLGVWREINGIPCDKNRQLGEEYKELGLRNELGRVPMRLVDGEFVNCYYLDLQAITLSWLNDIYGYSFNDIANFCEKYADKVFTEPK